MNTFASLQRGLLFNRVDLSRFGRRWSHQQHPLLSPAKCPASAAFEEPEHRVQDRPSRTVSRLQQSWNRLGFKEFNLVLLRCEKSSVFRSSFPDCKVNWESAKCTKISRPKDLVNVFQDCLGHRSCSSYKREH